mmetsp:Transcript_19725/g.36265  ORF Transcript_19725/g.36265 Transcript_19725/m.36265 type:complete len:752 (+) Transcript_19725:275-2530(+)
MLASRPSDRSTFQALPISDENDRSASASSSRARSTDADGSNTNNYDTKKGGIPSCSSQRQLQKEGLGRRTYTNTKLINLDEDEMTQSTAIDDDGGSGDGRNRKKAPMMAMATMRRLLGMARPERHLMIMSVISMGLSSAVSLAVPSFSGRIIDLSIGPSVAVDSDNDGDASSESPFRLLVILLGVMTLSGFFGFFRILWQAKAGHRLVARLRRNLYAAVLSQDAAYFDSAPVGDVLSRLSSDADLVQSAVTNSILALLSNTVIAMGAICLLLVTSASLAAVSVSILPPIACTARFVGRRMKDRYQKVRELHARATSFAEQALTCIRTVQQFVMEDFESKQYNEAVNAAHAESIQNAKLSALFRSVTGLVVNLALLCVLGYGGKLVSEKKLTPGDLASFVMYSVMMGTNVSGISSQYIDLMKAIAAADRVFSIIDREPSIPPPLNIGQASQNDDLLILPSSPIAETKKENDNIDALEMVEIGGEPFTNESACSRRPTHNLNTQMVPLSVEFQNITFSYPTRPETKILDNFNLTVNAGGYFALVGGSGAGKSTLASLLTRMYNPQNGTILLDGNNIETMDPQDIRHKIGIVVQEPLLFPTSIEANIRYGTPGATSEQVCEAARSAYVLDFTDKFPEGLQTLVGPRGTQLSGGQKQRVALARCILKNPQVVIFDEATSALDAESESQVQKAIYIACKGRTVIMIAHRLSTIRNAETIAVLQDGQIAEIGSFSDLVASNSKCVFKNLMEKQLLVH